jgi:hypothetical protein
MNESAVTNNVVYLIDRLYKSADASIYSLLKASGYFELHKQINKEEIYYMLVDHPGCIGQWLTWSESKRTASGWYIRKGENGNYFVGHHPRGDMTEREYHDVSEACAAFIKAEIEDIRIS